MLEINPRFAGGCTCAIEAGLDMPYYLLAEAMGIDFAPPARLKRLHMTRARRVHEVNAVLERNVFEPRDKFRR